MEANSRERSLVRLIDVHGKCGRDGGRIWTLKIMGYDAARWLRIWSPDRVVEDMHTRCTSAVSDSVDVYISRCGKDSHILYHFLNLLVVNISNATRVNKIFLCASSLHVLKAMTVQTEHVLVSRDILDHDFAGVLGPLKSLWACHVGRPWWRAIGIWFEEVQGGVDVMLLYCNGSHCEAVEDTQRFGNRLCSSLESQSREGYC